MKALPTVYALLGYANSERKACLSCDADVRFAVLLGTRPGGRAFYAFTFTLRPAKAPKEALPHMAYFTLAQA